MSRLIVATRTCPCVTCRKRIHEGDKVYWEPKIGCWHQACPEPPNLGDLLRRRDRKDAVE